MRYVAYYRVSTVRQENSKLGLQAQQETVRQAIAGNGELIAEFTETKSGAKDGREELKQAISLAKRENCRLIIARLDRFSRRVSFIASIMEQGVTLTVAEMPNASDFQLHIFAALAQEERRLISDRTKQALRQAKLRGTELGKHGKVLGGKRKKEASEHSQSLKDNIGEEWKYLSYNEIRRRLRQAGIQSRTGCDWSPQAIKNYFHS